jgi:tetratricopeptide (TPR) repeat protein
MAAIDKALAIDPELAEAHAARGLALQLVYADSLSAIDAYRQAISINQNLAYIHYRLGRYISLRVFGQEHDFAAFAEEAEAALEAAIALDPMSTESRRWLGILTLKVARNVAALGRPDEAIRKLRPAFIDQPRVNANIASFYLDLNAPQMAEQILVSVEHPESAVLLRIQLALAQDQYEVAAALTHELEPGVLPPLYEMVIGHDDHARGLYEQISAERALASRKENFRWGYYPAINAAHLASEAGEAETAAEMLRTARAALEEAIGNKYTAGGAYYLLASISALEGNAGEALNMLEKAIASGWTRHWYAGRDPNLEGLWNDIRFQSLINDVRNHMDRLRLELEPVAAALSDQQAGTG